MQTKRNRRQEQRLMSNENELQKVFLKKDSNYRTESHLTIFSIPKANTLQQVDNVSTIWGGELGSVPLQISLIPICY